MGAGDVEKVDKEEEDEEEGPLIDPKLTEKM